MDSIRLSSITKSNQLINSICNVLYTKSRISHEDLHLSLQNFRITMHMYNCHFDAKKGILSNVRFGMVFQNPVTIYNVDNGYS